jgi:hypothetical protein
MWRSKTAAGGRAKVAGDWGEETTAGARRLQPARLGENRLRLWFE